MTDERDDEAPVIKVTDKRRFADLERVEAGETSAWTSVLTSSGIFSLFSARNFSVV